MEEPFMSVLLFTAEDSWRGNDSGIES